jgi:sugar lactone lactonase YvrE
MLKSTLAALVARRATIILFCALLAACGGGGGNTSPAGNAATNTPAGAATAADKSPQPEPALAISAESTSTAAGGRNITLQASGFSPAEVPLWSLRSGDLGSLDNNSGVSVSYIPPAADPAFAGAEVYITVKAGTASATLPLTITRNIDSGDSVPAPANPAPSGSASSSPGNPAQPRPFHVIAQSDRAVAGGSQVTMTASKPVAGDTVVWNLEAGSPGGLDRTSGDTVQYVPPPAGSLADSIAVNVKAAIGSMTKKITIFLEGTHGLSLLAGNDFGAGTVNASGKAARFQAPYGIAADAQGNLYVTDGGTSIRKITAEGSASTLAGSATAGGSADGAGTSARFAGITDIAIDAAGNLYATDSANHTIRKITPDGIVTTLAGTYGVSGTANGTGASAQFNRPTGITVDATGNLYVSDKDNMMIRRVTPAGVVTTVAQDAPGTASESRLFGSPWGIAVDSAGNLYVVDAASRVNFCCSDPASYYSSAIRKITPQGVITTLAGSHGTGLGGAVDLMGNQDGTGTAARFSGPVGITIDASGNLYVTDAGTRIRKITPAGVVSTLAGAARSQGGSADGNAGSALFSGLRDITVDSAGNLYLAEAANRTIRKLAVNAEVVTVAGTAPRIGYQDGSGRSALFESLDGIVSDAQGNLYVADKWNKVVRKITSSSEVSTFAGTPGSTGNSDDLLNNPENLAIDASGNIYVGSHADIRKISNTGVVSVVARNVGRPELTLASAPAGYVYTTDFQNILEISTITGTVRTLATTRYPAQALATDKAGNIYVYSAAGLEKITSEGVVTTVVAPMATGTAYYAMTYSLATDEQGNQYLASSKRGETVIRKITENGIVSKVFEYNGDDLSSGNHLHLPAKITMREPGTIAITVGSGVFLLRLPKHEVSVRLAGGCSIAACKA